MQYIFNLKKYNLVLKIYTSFFNILKLVTQNSILEILFYLYLKYIKYFTKNKNWLINISLTNIHIFNYFLIYTTFKALALYFF